MNNRINWIDWAKVIGIFLVVIGHGYWISDTIFIRTFIYSFHMPFFFVISGYLHKDSASFKDYMKKNTRTLLIPYLILPILACIYVIPIRLHLDSFNINDIIIGYITGDAKTLPGGACWFIYCLFIVKILAYILLKAPKYIQALLLFLAFLCVYYHIVPFKFRINSAFIAIAFFTFGYYLKQYEVLKYFSTKYIICICLLILFSILLTTSQINGDVDIHETIFGKSVYLYYLNAIIGSMMLILLSKLFNNVTYKFIVTISSGTLLIMAFHTNYFFVLIHKYLNIPDSFNLFANIIISMTIIIMLYYPILFIQRKYPFILGGR